MMTYWPNYFWNQRLWGTLHSIPVCGAKAITITVFQLKNMLYLVINITCTKTAWVSYAALRTTVSALDSGTKEHQKTFGTKGMIRSPVSEVPCVSILVLCQHHVFPDSSIGKKDSRLKALLWITVAATIHFLLFFSYVK